LILKNIHCIQKVAFKCTLNLDRKAYIQDTMPHLARVETVDERRVNGALLHGRRATPCLLQLSKGWRVLKFIRHSLQKNEFGGIYSDIVELQIECFCVP
jgi:hypothetical protein